MRTHGSDIQTDIKLNYGLGLNNSIEKIKFSLNTCKKLIALTSDVKNIYLTKGIPDKKIEIIPNAIELNLFKRKEFSLLKLNRKIKLLSVGRYHKKKGFDLIPKAIDKLIKNGIDFEWTIIGKNLKNVSFLNDDKYKNYIKIIDEINPSLNHQEFNFPSTELRKKYFEADIFIMTSYLETFGMVLIEAMASGLYIISSNSEGCRNVIDNYKNGILFEKGDTTDLVNKIKKLVVDEKLQEQIYYNLIKDIKKFDWEVVSEKYIQVYKNEISKFNKLK